jgi:outer membrane protein assembly factor BamA
MKKNIFLYHIIYILFFNLSFSQNLQLKLKGTDSASTSFLNKIDAKKSFKDLKSLQNEIDNIKKKTQNHGYFNAQFLPKNKINDSTHLQNISLGFRYKKININYNNKQITESELKNILDEESEINNGSFVTNTNQLEQNLNNIIKHLNTKGKVFSKLQLNNISINTNNVSADLFMDISETNYISDIKIKGYKRFPKKFIRHYLRIKKQKELNLEDLEEKSEGINNLLFASEIKKPEILFTKDSTIIYLYLKKEKSNSFEGFLGFSTNQQSNKIELNGNINLKLINNLNSGEELHLKYQSTENEQKHTNIKLKTPYIFNTPFSIEGELDIFKKDSSFTNNTQAINTKYTISKNTEVGIGLEFNTSNSLIKNSINSEDFKRKAYTFSFSHKKPNKHNNLFPYKTRTTIKFSLASRKTELRKTPQQNLFISSEYIFKLNEKNSFFLKSENYYLFSNTTLENELHYIGGINSIRGLKENSIPSAQYSVLNSEYRVKLNKTLYTHTVIDYAITKNNSNNNFDNLFGFGIGFGLKTNNSLLRFIFANSKVKDEEIKFSDSKIHLSLSTFF